MDLPCPNCDAPVPETTRICPYCGESIFTGDAWPPAPHGDEPPPPSYKLMSRWPWLDFALAFVAVSIGSLMVVVGLVVWGYFYFGAREYRYVLRGATLALVVWAFLIGGWLLDTYLSFRKLIP